MPGHDLSLPATVHASDRQVALVLGTGETRSWKARCVAHAASINATLCVKILVQTYALQA